MKVFNLIFSVLTVAMMAFRADAVIYQTRVINDYKQTPVPTENQILLPQHKVESSHGFMRGSIFADTASCTRCKKGGSIFNVQSCTRCTKDGSMFPGGSCVHCSKDGSMFPGGACKKCKQKKVKPVEPCRECGIAAVKPPFIIEYTDIEEHKCSDFAPFMLGHVDFRLKNGWNSNNLNHEKLGNYNFRIFGCRRFDKEAFLNEGRVMQKDIRFTDAFAGAVSECYNMLQIPEDLCLQQSPTELPEYVLNAEITDYFMNICDGYDWNNADKSDRRAGSSEITVKWKLMNLAQTNVVWEGTTTGYAELEKGEENGEILLIEKAFADAASNLQIAEGFENQLASRMSAEQMAAQRTALIEQERLANPAKCMYKEQIEQITCPACQCQAQAPAPTCQAQACPLPACQAQTCQAPACQTQPCQTGTCPCLPTEITYEPIVVDDVYVEVAPEPVVEVVEEVIEVAPEPVEEVVEVVEEVVEVTPEATIEEKSSEIDTENLCIVDRPPYEVLSPENLYKVRASILSITNSHGEKGAGLLVSDSFVLTSAELIDGQNNVYGLKTINGKTLKGRAFRVNPTKNIALIMLDEPTTYTPLPLNLDLPEIGKDNFMVLGMLDVDDFENGENYLDSDGVIDGYRYTDDKGAEIILDTYVQDITIGGALIDQFGTINGIAHSTKKTEDGKDLFIPTETALRAVGLSICEKIYKTPSPWQTTIYKPITKAIENPVSKAPEAMPVKDRK